MKKSRIVVLSNRESTGYNIKMQLVRLFGEIFDVENYSLEKLINSYITADIVLSTSYNIIGEFIKFIAPNTDIYIVRCTLERESWEKVMRIPPRTKAYIVSDFDDASITSATLYELGARHLELIAYDPNDEFDPNIKIAIIQNNEIPLPKTISQRIYIKERVLDAYTLFDILGKLGKLNGDTSQIIIDYMGKIIPRSPGFLSIIRNVADSKFYLENIINVLNEGFILFDQKSNIISLNKWAEELFGVNSWTVIGYNVNNFLYNYGLDKLTNKNQREIVVDINDMSYVASRYELVEGKKQYGGLIKINKYENIEKNKKKYKNKILKKGYIAKYTFKDIIGISDKMTKTINIAKKMALNDSAILILGESGTGKELFAQAMHSMSKRRDNPFLAYNCATISDTLGESELFGYEDGAFTGAKKGGKLGLFEVANTGTLFLDEIGDLSLNMQAKLLRVLEEQEIVRVGGNEIIPVDIRIIAATNKDLEKLVQEGKFREDLYYRLNTMELHIPPLRERKEDIPHLMKHMLDEKGINRDIPNNIIETFQAYDWPGNVRELRNCIEYMCNVSGGNITIDHLPKRIIEDRRKFVLSKISELGNKDEIIAILYALSKKKDEIQKNKGRRSLSKMLYNQGFDLSECEIRSILKKLEREGLVIINIGRKGTKLSPQGEELINKLKC